MQDTDTPSPDDFIDKVGKISTDIPKAITVVLRVPVEPSQISSLLSNTKIVNVILAEPDPDLGAATPGRIGWYSSIECELVLPAELGTHLLFLGSYWDLGFRAALNAWRRGARVLHFLSPLEGHTAKPFITTLAQQALAAIFYRADKTRFSPLIAWLFSIHGRSLERKLRRISRSEYFPVKNRILLVANSLGPGGAERQVANTLVGLKMRGVSDVSLLHEAPMSPPHDFFLEEIELVGCVYHKLKDINSYPFRERQDNSELSAIRRALQASNIPYARVLAYVLEFRQRRPEIVHTWLDDINVIAGLAAVLVGIPKVIIGCRSLSPDHFQFHQPYMKPLYRLLAKSPNVIFLNNSKAGAESYEKWLADKSIEISIVHNGFRFSEHHPDDAVRRSLASSLRKDLGIPPHARIVGTVMRLSIEKQPQLWIEAAAQVWHEVSSVHFVVIGDGPLRAQLESASRSLGIGSAISFLGRRENAPELMATMDVFLLTSAVEGLPNVVIEAQAAGIPVVATGVGGVREIYDNEVTGIIINSPSPQAIAQGVIRALTDPDLKKRCKKQAPQLMRRRFSTKRMIDETLEIYGR